MDRVYHDLRKTSPEAARLLVRKVLEQNGGKRKYTLGISHNTIKAILRRHGQRRKKRRVRRGSRPLYDYEHLLPFEEMQVLLRMDFGSEFCGPPPKKQRPVSYTHLTLPTN